MSSSKKSRRKYTTEQKVAILRRHMIDKVPVSELCNELGIQPSVFYQWQKQALDNLTAALTTQVVAAASKVQAGEQLTVVGSDFYGSYWFPSGERRRTEKPLAALTQALGWITPSRNPPPPTQLSLFAEKRRDATVRVVGRVALPKERTPKTTPSARKSPRKKPSKSKSRRT